MERGQKRGRKCCNTAQIQEKKGEEYGGNEEKRFDKVLKEIYNKLSL